MHTDPKTGGFPNISFIMRKPENLGTEFKSVVCPVLGVMTYLEIQMGKHHMKKAKYFTELGATAFCGLRASEYLTCKSGQDPEELVLGDSWFGSVKVSVAQSQAGFECCFQVKTNTTLFSKVQIEEALKDAPGGTSITLKGMRSSGVELIAIGYKSNKKKSSPGAGSTIDGKPYEMKWSDEHGNVHV